MAVTTFAGNGWKITMDNLSMVFDRGVDRINVCLLTDMPVGKTASDLRLVVTENLNQNTSEMTYVLNEFFTGSR